jgi:hypothetical protein
LKFCDCARAEADVKVFGRQEVGSAVELTACDYLDYWEVDEPSERLLEIVDKRELRGRRLMEEADRWFEPDRVYGVSDPRFEEWVSEVEEGVDGVGRGLRPWFALPLPRDEPSFGPKSVDDLGELGPVGDGGSALPAHQTRNGLLGRSSLSLSVNGLQVARIEPREESE